MSGPMFLSGKFSEGSPNGVNEALACGAPVVVSRVGTVPTNDSERSLRADRSAGRPEFSDLSTASSARKEWDRAVISEWGRSRSWEQVALEMLEFCWSQYPDERRRRGSQAKNRSKRRTAEAKQDYMCESAGCLILIQCAP